MYKAMHMSMTFMLVGDETPKERENKDNGIPYQH
jgi:hypothetical protein